MLLQVPLRLQDPGFRRPLPCPLGPRCCLEEPPCTHPSHPVVAEAGGVPVALVARARWQPWVRGPRSQTGFKLALNTPTGPRCLHTLGPPTVAAESSQGGSVAIPWAPLVAVVDLEGGRW